MRIIYLFLYILFFPITVPIHIALLLWDWLKNISWINLSILILWILGIYFFGWVFFYTSILGLLILYLKKVYSYIINFFNSNNFNSSSSSSSRKPIPDRVKDKVWNRDGGKCVQCDSNKNLEFDHIIPHSKRGANTYRNLQLLCESCNRSKGAKIG